MGVGIKVNGTGGGFRKLATGLVSRVESRYGRKEETDIGAQGERK